MAFRLSSANDSENLRLSGEGGGEISSSYRFKWVSRTIHEEIRSVGVDYPLYFFALEKLINFSRYLHENWNTISNIFQQRTAMFQCLLKYLSWFEDRFLSDWDFQQKNMKCYLIALLQYPHQTGVALTRAVGNAVVVGNEYYYFIYLFSIYLVCFFYV